jgi:hypothetical protein
MRTNDDERRDLWNAHIYTEMTARAESRATTITTTTTDDNDDDETAVADIAR